MPRSFHAEVVAGQIAACRFLYEHTSEQRSTSFADVYEHAVTQIEDDETADKNGLTPSSYVLEFLKDGVRSMRDEQWKRIIGGDYSDLWAAANRYLKMFGHEPIEPEEIKPAVKKIKEPTPPPPPVTPPPPSIAEQCSVAAARWWANRLRGGSPLPIGTHETVRDMKGDGAVVFMYTIASIPSSDGNTVNAFEKRLAEMILERLNRQIEADKKATEPRSWKPSVSLNTDYGPEGLLADAMMETGCRGSLAFKTSVSVYEKYVTLSVIRGVQDEIIIDLREPSERLEHWRRRLEYVTDSVAWYNEELKKKPLRYDEHTLNREREGKLGEVAEIKKTVAELEQLVKLSEKHKGTSSS